ncbi:glycosyl hydrolase 108 family protein [Ferruginibacter albus]|uniref:glycosyl hydrolase 108 family protein n=1 Tax=Ferruginibacter albus TaxID=2875540 RepID=UPI001CC599CC|nr:glycosyl hydrolase 108 family protein [Ferruginibacter albus]UAY53255.1 hypothetical protein K9M53_06180 [Ferruginibacter albus]
MENDFVVSCATNQGGDVVTANDYYPFGMSMPGRSYSNGREYRYGFNGKEKDPDMDGNNYDYGFRIYNPGLGRFLSVDPLTEKYPWYTPYQFAGNSPIQAIDLDGLEEWKVKDGPANGTVYGPYKNQDEAQKAADRGDNSIKLEPVTVIIHKKPVTNNQSSAPTTPSGTNSKADFKIANAITSKNEGGWSFKKQDPGGATNRGIIFSNFKKWAQPDLGVEPTIDNLKKLTPEQASIIFQKHYWNKINGDEFNNQSVANAIYDFSVQSGNGINEVEKAYNATFGGGITVDGKLRKEEVTLLNKVDSKQLFDLVQQTRLNYMNTVVIPKNVASYKKKHPNASDAEINENTLLKWKKSLNDRITRIQYTQ